MPFSPIFVPSYFFSSPKPYVEYRNGSYTDRRPYLRKVLACAISFLKQLRFMFFVLCKSCWKYAQNLLFFQEKNVSWKKDSKALVVLLHGLFGSPCIWYRQQDLLKQCEGIDVYAAPVYKRGNCSLEDAAMRIQKVIENYRTKHPNPIILIGNSNGARVAARVYIDLMKKQESSPNKYHLHLSLIAGALQGCRTIDCLSDCCLTRFLLDPALRKELRSDSLHCQKLLQAFKRSIKRHNTSVEFYATLDDTVIPRTHSSCPIVVSSTAQVYLRETESHNSITAAVAKQQVNGIERFLNKVEQHSQEKCKDSVKLKHLGKVGA